MTNEDYSKPVCYFYIDDKGKIAYVGKANGTIVDRVRAHSKEEKFINCRCNFDIRYQVFDRTSDMDIAEKVYIKSLKPYLNVVDKTDGFFPDVNIDLKNEKQFIIEKKIRHKKKINEIKISDLKRNREQELDSYLKNLIDNIRDVSLSFDRKSGKLKSRCRALHIATIPHKRKEKIIFSIVMQAIFKLFDLQVIWRDDDSIAFAIEPSDVDIYEFFLNDLKIHCKGASLSDFITGSLDRTIYETRKKKEEGYILKIDDVHGYIRINRFEHEIEMITI